MTKNKQQFGNWGEEQALQFLQRNGYTIVEQNFSCRMGEIDIIAYRQDKLCGNILCFVEVKTRSTSKNGSAERAVGRKKMLHMRRVAIFYCKVKKINSEKQHISFEQISVYMKRGKSEGEIRWYQIPSF